MRALVFLWITVVVLPGCHAGFRSANGTALAPDGTSPGITRSVAFGDQGGLLSRAILSVLGVGVTATSLSNAKVETSTNRVGDSTVATERRSADVDTGVARAGGDLVNAAADPNVKLRGTNLGLASNLEIASRTLGGDTSGAQLDAGLGFQFRAAAGPLFLGFRGYVGVGYGSFTTHDRPQRVDRGPPTYTDAAYEFLGVPARLGVFLTKAPFPLSRWVGIETFARAGLNASGPHSLFVGQRLQLSLLYVEVEAGGRGLGADDRSVGIEIGIGI